jgi:nucleoid-associated protein YgaU
MASNDTPSPVPPSRQKLVWLGVLVVTALLIAARLLMDLTSAPAPAPQATAPTPAHAAPTPLLGPALPSFDVVRVDAQGNAVFAGRGEPGATVTIKDGDTVLGTVTADSQGAFVLVPANPLPPGAQEITLSETLISGQKLDGTATAELDVPKGAGAPLAVLSGPGGSTVVSGQGPQAGTLGMGAVDYDTQGHAIFSGTAPAGASISLQLGGHIVGGGTADTSGHWRITAPTPAQGGTLTLGGTTAAGAALPPVTVPFALESLPYALAEGHVVIVPGDNLWMIARHVYGHGTMYTLIYDANAHQIQNPNLIYPGQNFALPKPKAP